MQEGKQSGLPSRLTRSRALALQGPKRKGDGSSNQCLSRYPRGGQEIVDSAESKPASSPARIKFLLSFLTQHHPASVPRNLNLYHAYFYLFRYPGTTRIRSEPRFLPIELGSAFLLATHAVNLRGSSLPFHCLSAGSSLPYHGDRNRWCPPVFGASSSNTFLITSSAQSSPLFFQLRTPSTVWFGLTFPPPF
jgi:hypothetical protein